MLTLPATQHAAPVNAASLSAPENNAANANTNGTGALDAAVTTKAMSAKAAFPVMLAAMRASAVRPAANTALAGSATGTTADGQEVAAGLALGAETGDASKGLTGAPDPAATDAASLLAMLERVADATGTGPDGGINAPAAQVLPAMPGVRTTIQTPAAPALAAEGAAAASAVATAARTHGTAIDGGGTTRGSSEGKTASTLALCLAIDNTPPAAGTGTSAPAAAGVHARSVSAAPGAQSAATPPSPAVPTAESSGSRPLAGEGSALSSSLQTNAAAPATATATVPGMMWSAPPGASAAPAPVAVTIATPVHSPYFAEETAQQVTWLTTHGIEQARIHVTPADLGPIEIRIAIEDGEALINFAVTHPESAAAIEDALPRLREMLAASGITLGQTSVGDEHSAFGAAFGSGNGDRETAGRRGEAAAFAQRDAAPERDATRTGAVQPRAGTRLVDLFA